MTRFERKAVVIELAILTVTLIITLVIGLGVYYQTSRHFTIQRTSYLIERFNQRELVDDRETTDNWLETKEDPRTLMNRSIDPYSEKPESQKTEAEKLESEKAKKAAEKVKNIRVFCNFFQELGTAVKHDTVDEEYMWDVFGAAVTLYGEQLRQFVEELRVRRHRPELMQEFLLLIDKMKELNKKYGQK